MGLIIVLTIECCLRKHLLLHTFPFSNKATFVLSPQNRNFAQCRNTKWKAVNRRMPPLKSKDDLFEVVCHKLFWGGNLCMIFTSLLQPEKWNSLRRCAFLDANPDSYHWNPLESKREGKYTHGTLKRGGQTSGFCMHSPSSIMMYEI